MIVAIITTAMATTTTPSSLADAIELLLQRRRSRRGVSFSMPAMRPISVRMPVAVTIARPRP